MKLKLLRNLMGKLDVIAMQESHGDAGDSAALGRIFPDWLFLESASVGTVGGGTVLAIRKSYRNNFLHMEHTTILPGRVHAVALSELNGQQLVFVNLHIPPRSTTQPSRGFSRPSPVTSGENPTGPRSSSLGTSTTSRQTRLGTTSAMANSPASQTPSP